jgi:DNA mismatch repair protein MutS
MIFNDYEEYKTKYTKIYGDKCVILMEVGSFFELYSVCEKTEDFSDNNIHTISNLLNIQVSKKNKNILLVSENNPYMAGFPNHALKKFIDILIHNQYTVVLIEQVTQPPNPKREVTQILSPSTYVDNIVTYESKCVMSIFIEKHKDLRSKKQMYEFGVCIIDISTGTNLCTNVLLNECDIQSELSRLFIQYSPKEILLSSAICIDSLSTNIGDIIIHNKINSIEKHFLDINYQNKLLEKVYDTKGILSPIEFINLEYHNIIVISLCILIQFIYEHNETLLKKIRVPTYLEQKEILHLANDSLHQLNILGSKYCLQNLLNNCSTNIGKRWFKQSLLNPIVDVAILKERYEKVEYYIGEARYKNVRNILRNIVDLERLLNTSYINPYNLYNIYKSLNGIEDIYNSIQYYECIKYIERNVNINILYKYSSTIDENIMLNNEEITNQELKRSECISCYENEIKNIKQFIKYEFCEKEGISIITTKKKFNDIKKHDDRFFEISSTKNNIKITNNEIIKKNSEYIKIHQIYTNLILTNYTKFINELLTTYGSLFDDVILYIRETDVVCTNAYNAVKHCYCKPKIIESDSSNIECSELRHPIVENVQQELQYISNDLTLSNARNGFLLFGINASGKSCFMKSIGLSIIMAQSGMYVPATTFTYCPFRSLYTRILNVDNIYKGQSTFVYEISELRNIMQNANERSLVIGDELCSGTESISAVSIVASSILSLYNRKAKFILATHLHELCKIDEIIENKNIQIKHLGITYDTDSNSIIYNRKLKDGHGETLYGLEVCKSLNMADDFMKKANDIRNKLLKKNTKLLNSKSSVYNKKVIKDNCKICNDNSIDIHHINEQCLADGNGNIGNFHKNKAFNLIPVCKKCHNNIHSKDIIVKGFIQTLDGIKLETSIVVNKI